MKKINFTILVAMIIWVAALSSVQAEVKHRQINPLNLIVDVSDEAWQPEGFENGTAIPATYLYVGDIGDIVIDGKANESVWKKAEEIEVPLSYGTVNKVFLKAVYTDQEVFIRLRWADDDEDRQYHPWIWSPEQNKYLVGPQVEDSVLLSFEAGCDWNPSFLAGYVFDFDGWHWLAARSDPLGQALDLYGNVQDQDMDKGYFTRFQSRNENDVWNMKFIENNNPDLHANWDDLDRVYMLQPVNQNIYYKAAIDGRNPQAFVTQLAAPGEIPYPRDESKALPQYSPVKLQDGAGEVKAKGHWENGFWTVEFRRGRVTPAKTINDTIFNRLTQFSVYVFDHTEKIDEASESKRLFLQFLPAGKSVVSN